MIHQLLSDHSLRTSGLVKPLTRTFTNISPPPTPPLPECHSDPWPPGDVFDRVCALAHWNGGRGALWGQNIAARGGITVNSQINPSLALQLCSFILQMRIKRLNSVSARPGKGLVTPDISSHSSFLPQLYSTWARGLRLPASILVPLSTECLGITCHMEQLPMSLVARVPWVNPCPH